MTSTAQTAPPVNNQPPQPSFAGVLFRCSDTRPAAAIEEPPCFRDLNLDQVVESLTLGKSAYDLTEFFYRPLSDAADVRYRQEIFDGLDGTDVLDAIRAFAGGMQAVRDVLTRSAKVRHRPQKQRWFLDAAQRYTSAVTDLTTRLDDSTITATGLLGLRSYLRAYRAGAAFRALDDDANSARVAIDSVRYNILVRANRVTVSAFDDEPDYGRAVAATFERFQQGQVASYLDDRAAGEQLNHVDAQVLDQVTRLYPAVFAQLDSFCRTHTDFIDGIVRDFDREIQFYVTYLEFITPLRGVGLTLTLPEVSTDTKREHASKTFDLALAHQLAIRHTTVVTNDFYLHGSERIFVVSGPNNGGKTTFARTYGQLHYLARLGLPVPGSDVELFLCDEILTHFEREEDIETLAGKLQDELNRLHDDFDRATSASVVIMNEMFSSTTLQDALYLSTEMLNRVSALDALCVCVTFLDELASLNDKTVSMVSTVVPDDPATRTHKLVRKPADGRAYARALAEKYGLTRVALTKRISR